MRQRCWLWMFCLLSCIFCSGRTQGQSAFADKPPLLIHQHLDFQPHHSRSLHSNAPLLSLVPADTLHRGRFWVATGLTTALYAGTAIALNEAWYKQFPRSSFHFFNDVGEWRAMDKMGHLYTTYFESVWSYHVARWTGLNENTSTWSGAALGLIFQGTVEVLDGFSEEWGFSVADAGFDLLGASAFVAQQKGWGEQRIRFKVSSTPINYPDVVIHATEGSGLTTLPDRADDLFGTGYTERFLKDYNAQTTWVSANISAFLKPESRFPKWLNIAVGYSAENMFGGFDNMWEDDDGNKFELSGSEYPRYSQYYLSPDIDFTRIPLKSPFLRTMFGMLNVFKVPGPVLGYSKQEGLHARIRW